MAEHPLVGEAVACLTELVGFDTTSHLPNRPLLEWVEARLAPLRARFTRVAGPDAGKYSLIASFGPEEAPGGIVLSGHVDVVPVAGQAWSSDPFTLTERDGRLYGRGACDMKGFAACCIAMAPRFAAADLRAPVHLALSHDEEVGCLAAPALARALSSLPVRPEMVIVGEPTRMQVVSGHKGLGTWTVEVSGLEAHSSQVDLGVSAIMEAIPLLDWLRGRARSLRPLAPAGSPFQPPGTTLTIGLIEGGSAVNILAKSCRFSFDVRFEDEGEVSAVLSAFEQRVADLDSALRARAPGVGARCVRRSFTPPLVPEPGGGRAEALARALTGDNASRAVAYGTEGGVFQRAGLSTVICGPGDIAQAHQPDEYVERAELEACVGMLSRLADRLSA